MYLYASSDASTHKKNAEPTNSKHAWNEACKYVYLYRYNKLIISFTVLLYLPFTSLLSLLDIIICIPNTFSKNSPPNLFNSNNTKSKLKRIENVLIYFRYKPCIPHVLTRILHFLQFSSVFRKIFKLNLYAAGSKNGLYEIDIDTRKTLGFVPHIYISNVQAFISIVCKGKMVVSIKKNRRGNLEITV